MQLSTRNSANGFTLIELLIVIAIIGILSAVVLVALNDARGRGADSAIKKSLAQAIRQAEVYVDANGRSYEGVCASTPVNGVQTIYSLGKSAADRAGVTYTASDSTVGTMNGVVCHDTDDGWMIQSPLKSPAPNGGAWHVFCVDSQGIATTSVANRATGPISGVVDVKCI